MQDMLPIRLISSGIGQGGYTSRYISTSPVISRLLVGLPTAALRKLYPEKNYVDMPAKFPYHIHKRLR